MDIQFRIPTLNDIDQLRENFLGCQWIHDNIDLITQGDPNVNNLRILIINGEIIGIVNFYYTGQSIDQTSIPLYYVSTRCTKDKDPENKDLNNIYITSDKFTTPGRLLWAYILREIYLINKRKAFVVYNHSIKSAYPYHIKMGMTTADKIRLGQHITLNDLVFPMFLPDRDPNCFLNTAKLGIYRIVRLETHPGYFEEVEYENNFDTASKIIRQKFNDTYLFYISRKINYESINDVLDHILKISSERPSERPSETSYNKRKPEELNENSSTGEENFKKKNRAEYGGRIRKKNKKTKNKIKNKTKNKRRNKTKNKRRNKTKNKRRNKTKNKRRNKTKNIRRK